MPICTPGVSSHIPIFRMHYCVQQDRLGRPVPQPGEGAEEVGNYVKSYGEGGGCGMRLGNAV